MTASESTSRRDTIKVWLATPLGQALLRQEASLLEEALGDVFGEHCLQLGEWGESNAFLRFARTQRAICILDRPGLAAAAPPSAYGRLHRLPVASESMDAVILPHTLEFSGRPHAILREVHRVLRADGRLIVLAFKPGGLWGLRRLIPSAGLPPAVDKLIADRQLCDWLQLLDMHIHGVDRYFFRWPLPGNRGQSTRAWEDRGRRWWPELAACFMLSAQKRVVTLTPVRKPWRSGPKVVGGLVKPTTRVVHVNFDQNGQPRT